MSKPLTALGLMSGTSLDGIDVALVTTDGENLVRRGPSRTYPYRADQQALLQDALADAKAMTDRSQRPGCLATAERELTEWHAAAVQSFCEETGVSLSEIAVIGFHGQTVLHRPDIRLTVQLGDGEALARRTGRPVVYDMRANDVAATTTWTGGTFSNATLRLGTAPIDHTAASTTWASNIGPDFTTVFNGNVTVQPNAAPGARWPAWWARPRALWGWWPAR